MRHVEGQKKSETEDFNFTCTVDNLGNQVTIRVEFPSDIP